MEIIKKFNHAKKEVKEWIHRDIYETSQEFATAAFAFGLGVGLGGIGKSTGNPMWYLFLPTVTMVGGGNAANTGHLIYYFGIASNYVYEIGIITANLLQRSGFSLEKLLS